MAIELTTNQDVLLVIMLVLCGIAGYISRMIVELYKLKQKKD